MEKNSIENIIVIIGKISSGKTTLANEISEKFGIPIISFGKYLAKFSLENSLPTSRFDLQNLGEKFIDEAPDVFLKNVLNSYIPIYKIIIVEGVRHLSILKLLREESRMSTFIYIETEKELRYTRYCNRIKLGDKELTFEEFSEMDNHSVESQIESLSDLCDIKYSNESQKEDLFRFLSSKYKI